MYTDDHDSWLTPVVAGVLSLVGLVSVSHADVFSRTRYVEIEHHTHSAYVYDEAFQRLPDHPDLPGSSIESFPEGRPLWFLGFNVDVIQRHDDGTIEVMSHDPAYFEMLHHLVLTYSSPNRPTVDRCTNRPIGTGSELTPVSWPAGYAYKMDGGAWFPSSWHWQNPTDLHPHEGIYVRLIELFDDASIYRDTHVTWVGSGTETEPCEEEFGIPPGTSDKRGLPWAAPDDLRVLFVGPHTHDHVESLELQVNGRPVRRFLPEYARVPVMHDDVGEGETPLHIHEDHLPSRGLPLWVPGVYGPTVKKGEQLSTYSRFNNPHEQSIDNMALFGIIWEGVSAD